MSWLAWRAVAGRVAALLVAGGLAGLVWISLLGPILGRYQDNDHAIGDGVHLRAALAAVIGQTGQTDLNAAALELDRFRGDFLSPGPEDSIVIADLQTRLSTLIAQRGGELGSARALPPKTQEGVTYLGLRVEIRAPMKAVHEILHAIETGTPLLFVERAGLRLDERGGGRNAVGDRIAPTSLALDVYAAKWPGPLSPGGSTTPPKPPKTP